MATTPRLSTLIGLIVIGVNALSLRPAAAQISFQGLAALTTNAQSEALKISADGKVIVGNSGIDPTLPEIFRWTLLGGLDRIGFVPGFESGSRAIALSGDGLTIVGDSYLRFGQGSTASALFTWTASGGVAQWPTYNDQVTGISHDGSVLVGVRGYTNSSGKYALEPTRWVSGTPQNLGTLRPGYFPPGDSPAWPAVVSADGKTVVGDASYVPPPDNGQRGNRRAFRWTPANGMENLGTLPGPFPSGIIGDSYATAVSADGGAIVGKSFSRISSSYFTMQAFRWTATKGMEALGLLPHASSNVLFSEAQSVSGDGSVVVGVSEAGATNRIRMAFFWNEKGGMQNLEQFLKGKGALPAGWSLLEATGVSADGKTIIGNGLNPAGRKESFRVFSASGWQNFTGFNLNSLTPPQVIAGSGPFTLTVNGSGFLLGSVVRFDGVAQTTNFVSDTQLNVPVLSAQIAQSKTINVTVANPGGVISNGLPLKVAPPIPAPVLYTLSPKSVIAESTGVILTVTGANFTPGATIRFGVGGFPLVTNFVSSSKLTASLPTFLIVSPGNYLVQVQNPVGPPSNGQMFVVNKKKPFPGTPIVRLSNDTFLRATILLRLDLECVFENIGDGAATVEIKSVFLNGSPCNESLPQYVSVPAGAKGSQRITFGPYFTLPDWDRPGREYGVVITYSVNGGGNEKASRILYLEP